MCLFVAIPSPIGDFDASLVPLPCLLCRRLFASWCHHRTVSAQTYASSGVVMVRSKRWLRVLGPLVACFIPGWAAAQNAAVTVNVDANANRHAISPYVYGIAYATSTTLADLNAPLNRYGGNNTSRYNWQLNADNRGSDWYFESIPEASATAGERGDTFISTTKAAG